MSAAAVARPSLHGTVGASGCVSLVVEADGSEVQRKAEARSLSSTQGSAVVDIPVDAATLEQLKKLHNAGVIDLGNALVLDTSAASRLRDWSIEEDFRPWMSNPVRNGRRAKPYAQSVIDARVRNLWFLVNHEEAPVQLWPPQEESWLAHTAYRLSVEGVNESVLENYRKTLQCCVEKFLGQTWPSLKGTYPQPNALRPVPTPAIMRRLWADKAGWYVYESKMLQHFVYHAAHVGFRPASEGVLLDLARYQYDGFTMQDVAEAANAGDRETALALWRRAERQVCRLTYVQPKKDGKENPRVLGPEVMTARNAPSLFNWVVYHRPKSGNGTPLTTSVVFPTWRGTVYEPEYFGNHVATQMKAIWPEFTTYCLRHYFAVRLLLQTYFETERFDIHLVAKSIGDTVAVTEKVYVRSADLLVQEIDLARKMGQKHPWEAL